jgi:hypothetical protein
VEGLDLWVRPFVHLRLSSRLTSGWQQRPTSTVEILGATTCLRSLIPPVRTATPQPWHRQQLSSSSAQPPWLRVQGSGASQWPGREGLTGWVVLRRAWHQVDASLCGYLEVMHEEQLRAMLRQRLGRRFTEGLWNLLVADGDVAEVIDLGTQPEAFMERAEFVLEHLQPQQVRSTSTPTEAPSPAHARERAAVLSDLVAEIARKDPDVLRFREKYIGNTGVPWPELESWIKQHAGQDPSRTIDITISVPAAQKTEPFREATDLIPYLPEARISRWSARVLDYAIPDNKWVHRISVDSGSMLDSLRWLSMAISKPYGWIPAQATVFVVSDIVAYIDPIRATEPLSQTRYNLDLGWTRRITLDIDPTLNPDEVAAAYQRIRSANGLDRTYPLSPKHLRLAAFTGADYLNRSWQERFNLWNRLYPGWAYSASSNFRRDAIRAQYRVLYPGRHRGSTPIRKDKGSPKGAVD